MKKYSLPRKEEVYPYQSRYGSHRDMVIKFVSGDKVVCRDELGEYTTDESKLDNNLADPKRYSGR